MGIPGLNKLHGNTLVIAKNTIYAFITNGVALAISFFSVPAFIRYFNNNEVLGLWYTLLAMLSWFLTFDLGIGNGIRNHLVIALSANNRIQVRQILSSGLFYISLITLSLSIIGLILISGLNLNSLFNIPDDIISRPVLIQSTICVFIAIMLRFMLTIVSSIFYALQRSAVNNFLALCVNILLLLFVLTFHFNNNEDSLFYISLAYLILCNLPLIIAGIWVYWRDFRDCLPSVKFISKDTSKKIIGIGAIFFICQISYTLIANTNEFFISHFWSTNDTADYGFYYRIVMLISMMVSLALSPTWSMITKAYAEKNYVWLSKLYKTMKIAGIGIVALQFAIIPVLQPIMDLWLGKGVITVTLYTSIAFACFGGSFLYSAMLSTIVCGLGKMKLQLWCYGLGAVAKVIFIVIIAKYSRDWTWVVWSNVFILAPYCLLQQIVLNKKFSNLKTAT